VLKGRSGFVDGALQLKAAYDESSGQTFNVASAAPGRGCRADSRADACREQAPLSAVLARFIEPHFGLRTTQGKLREG